MDAHERWEFNEETKIQKLLRIIALCKPCHEVTHIGFTRLKGRKEIAFRHLMRVKKNEEETQMHIDDAFRLWEIRSQFRWPLDLSLMTNPGIKLVCEFNSKERATLSHVPFDSRVNLTINTLFFEPTKSIKSENL